MRAELEQNPQRGVGRAAALEQLDREVEVDILAGSELAGADGVVTRPRELLRTPAFDPLGLGLDLDIELSS